MFTLNDVLDALDGHDEFVVKRYDGLVCVDYIVCFPGSFEATPEEVDRLRPQFGDDAPAVAARRALIRSNCRGITFDAATGDIVSLPPNKFFNINQVASTQFHLHRHKSAKVYEKADGSMIHFFIHPRGNLTAATCRSTETPQAKEALAMASADGRVYDAIMTLIAGGYTPVFELVGPHNQIVVEYPRPRLVYLISRNRGTGDYQFHGDMFEDKVREYAFNFADVFENLPERDMEGFVCHLECGTIVKVKSNWYTERHRAVDATMRPAYKLYQVVFDGVMDDLIAVATENMKPKLRAIYEEAQRDLLAEKIRLDKAYAECYGSLTETEEKARRKSFVEKVRATMPGDFAALMAIYSCKSPDKIIQDRLMEGYAIKYTHRLFSGDMSDVADL